MVFTTLAKENGVGGLGDRGEGMGGPSSQGTCIDTRDRGNAFEHDGGVEMTEMVFVDWSANPSGLAMSQHAGCWLCCVTHRSARASPAASGSVSSKLVWEVWQVYWWHVGRSPGTHPHSSVRVRSNTSYVLLCTYYMYADSRTVGNLRGGRDMHSGLANRPHERCCGRCQEMIRAPASNRVLAKSGRYPFWESFSSTSLLVWSWSSTREAAPKGQVHNFTTRKSQPTQPTIETVKVRLAGRCPWCTLHNTVREGARDLDRADQLERQPVSGVAFICPNQVHTTLLSQFFCTISVLYTDNHITFVRIQ